jgi:hypothetical protein
MDNLINFNTILSWSLLGIVNVLDLHAFMSRVSLKPVGFAHWKVNAQPFFGDFEFVRHIAVCKEPQDSTNGDDVLDRGSFETSNIHSLTIKNAFIKCS